MYITKPQQLCGNLLTFTAELPADTAGIHLHHTPQANPFRQHLRFSLHLMISFGMSQYGNYFPANQLKYCLRQTGWYNLHGYIEQQIRPLNTDENP